MSKMMIKELFEKNNIEINSLQEQKLSSYMEGILAWNEHINLTAITDPSEFILKHYVDSLSILPLPEFQQSKTVLDVGTGGGFPGIPLAIMDDDKSFTLLDSLNKRLKVIDELAEELGIINITTLHGRSEELGQNAQYRESFDLCVSRAVAELPVLLELCLPFVKKDGFFIAFKASDIQEELSKAEKALEKLGGTLIRIDKGYEGKSLLVIKKDKDTPKKYPRKPGEPKRNPL